MTNGACCGHNESSEFAPGPERDRGNAGATPGNAGAPLVAFDVPRGNVRMTAGGSEMQA